MFTLENDKIAHVLGKDELHVRGIHSFIHILTHEQSHKTDYLNGILDNPIGSGDWDSDGLDNNWEIQHGFDPIRTDTSGAYAGSSLSDGNSGDAEASADIQSYGLLVGTKELWQQDWAKWEDADMNMQFGEPTEPAGIGDSRRLKVIPWFYWKVGPPYSSNEPIPYLKQHPWTGGG